MQKCKEYEMLKEKASEAERCYREKEAEFSTKVLYKQFTNQLEIISGSCIFDNYQNRTDGPKLCVGSGGHP